MRWLKPLRSSKSKNNAKLNNNGGGGDFRGTDTYDSYGNPDNDKGKGGRRRHQNLSLPHHYFSRQQSTQTHQRTPSRDLTKFLPLRVITNILAHVCPHTQDESYGSSEESMTLDGCMLCDMRDLAHCALACKRWHGLAQELLYRHVRIDAVHYCERELELADKRKRRSFFDRNTDPEDAPRVRLLLFMRTVWDNKALAQLVNSLRTPYMTREASKGELARTVSVLPNIRYVDLPAGFFSDDPSCRALKQEMLARCPNIRRTKYAQGSEASFAQLPGSRRWMNLEVLELSKLNVDANMLRIVLSSFSNLRDLKLVDLPWLDDSIFNTVASLPHFPPVRKLTIQDAPNITARGLAKYASMSPTKDILTELIITNTGVLPQALHEILARAPKLRDLSIFQEVLQAFPIENVPSMSSRSLRLLHYEITAPHQDSGGHTPGINSVRSPYGVQPTAASYYTYLVSSLMSNNLPTLRELYVRDAGFPETLLLSPPPRITAGEGGGGRLPPTLGLNQPLNIYSKGLDEFEWNLTPYDPHATARGRRGVNTRPVSLHEAQLSPSWGGENRKSVVVGNGFGGFLAVPVDEGRPGSSGGGLGGGSWKRESKRESRYDLWR